MLDLIPYELLALPTSSQVPYELLVLVLSRTSKERTTLSSRSWVVLKYSSFMVVIYDYDAILSKIDFILNICFFIYRRY